MAGLFVPPSGPLESSGRPEGADRHGPAVVDAERGRFVLFRLRTDYPRRDGDGTASSINRPIRVCLGHIDMVVLVLGLELEKPAELPGQVLAVSTRCIQEPQDLFVVLPAGSLSEPNTADSIGGVDSRMYGQAGGRDIESLVRVARRRPPGTPRSWTGTPGPVAVSSTWCGLRGRSPGDALKISRRITVDNDSFTTNCSP
jgi:hypothetical protein